MIPLVVARQFHALRGAIAGIDWLRSAAVSVFGAGDAVLSESEPYLGDWKTGFDLAFPIC